MITRSILYTLSATINCIMILVVTSVGSSRSYGPRVQTLDDQCYSPYHCDTRAGQACVWRFEGCDHGHCLCDPATPFLDSKTGMCIRGLREGDECRVGEQQCPPGMQCDRGQCRCTDGQASKDGHICFKSTDRLLGHACNPVTDSCWQKHPSGSGYTQNNVLCVSGRCRCEAGLKDDGHHCHKRRIGDDCKQHNQCTGDALCLDGKCACLRDQGYRAVAKGTKCAPAGATVDLPLGMACDEQEQRSFCAVGLVCHRCRNDGPYKCLRPIYPDASSPAAYYNSVSRSSSRSQYLTFSSLWMTWTVCVCIQRITFFTWRWF